VISTNDPELYQVLRMLRAHGMVRESNSEAVRRSYGEKYPDLNPQFIFAYPAYNVRPTEINAIIGRSQLKRLDANNRIRTENLKLFLSHLDSAKYQTDFAIDGSSNYAFTLVLQQPDDALWDSVSKLLTQHGVEFRRGTSGGGNQLRQPYLRRLLGNEFETYPTVNPVHFDGCYSGNYPTLERDKILKLCELLNNLSAEKK
jgi:CDP-6-deoxy-D-xylo-4-hexulose-3-dehydrase